MNESSQAPKTIETSELRHIDNTNKTRVVTQRELLKDNVANDLKKRTENVKFNVTPAMLLYVDTAVKLVTDSPSDICSTCHISRDSWYRWIKLEGFEEWFYSQYKARRYRWLPRLDAMGLARAPKNFDYWKAMNQKAGELLDDQESQPQQRISILGGMTVQTVNNIKQDTTTKQQDT